jgi:serine/threonine-protein kinase
VLDSGADAGAQFIVLEYVAGETLKQRVRRGPLAIDEAIAYAIEVARALAAAHEHGIVHRDVKSQNILLGEDGGAKLTDFGIARFGQEVALTQGGRVLGTTDYVSPEQALGREVTGQSDIYSLGIVLFEALTGRVPFSGETRLAVAAAHVRAQLPDVQRLRPEVSATLAAVVEKATAKQCERRYADARALLGDLEAALAVETARSGEAGREAEAVLRTLPPSGRSTIPRLVRRRASLIASGAVVALLGVAVALFAFEGLRVHPAKARAPVRPRVRVVYTPVALRGALAVSYNPFGTGTPDDPLAAAQAIAGTGRFWATNRYDDDRLGKPGVGLYVELAAPVAAARLSLRTPTPGFDLEVWGAQRVSATAAVRDLSALGWRRLGSQADVGRTVLVSLGRAPSAFRYYLVWITRLEPGPSGQAVAASIGDVRLWRASRA